jgi:hypothetical protein
MTGELGSGAERASSRNVGYKVDWYIIRWDDGKKWCLVCSFEGKLSLYLYLMTILLSLEFVCPTRRNCHTDVPLALLNLADNVGVSIAMVQWIPKDMLPWSSNSARSARLLKVPNEVNECFKFAWRRDSTSWQLDKSFELNSKATWFIVKQLTYRYIDFKVLFDILIIEGFVRHIWHIRDLVVQGRSKTEP